MLRPRSKAAFTQTEQGQGTYRVAVHIIHVALVVPLPEGIVATQEPYVSAPQLMCAGSTEDEDDVQFGALREQRAGNKYILEKPERHYQPNPVGTPAGP